MEWLGFWIFLSVLVVVDAWMYLKGHDGMFFEHKTDEEKAIQHYQAYGMRITTETITAGTGEGKDD